LSQESSRVTITELHRDRYARTGEASYRLKKILLPCHGIGIRSKQDEDALIKLRMTHETSHLGFCITQLAYADGTLIALAKELAQEAVKFKPTAKGEQLKMFSEKTLFAVEPSTEFTYWDHKKTIEKLQASLETPVFLREYISELLQKREEFGIRSNEYKAWKETFFQKAWSELANNLELLDSFLVQNESAQKTCNADILILPTNPVISRTTFLIAKKIIERAAMIYGSSAALYLVLHPSVLKDDDLLADIVELYQTSKQSVLILKIKDFNPTEPDKIDARNAFADIQEAFCDIRKSNPKKCTIFLDGGKLTYPSIVRGFDIVTNHISGKNKLGGGIRRKNTQQPTKFSRYYIRKKMVTYAHERILELSKNELKLSNNRRALDCDLPCCKDIKTLDGLTANYWNFSIARPHFALTMNEDAKFISQMIYKNQIQKTKDPLLKSELCILKNLIPDV
jgi:hypothetical protein